MGWQVSLELVRFAQAFFMHWDFKMYKRVGEKDITLADFRSIYDLKVKKYADRGRDIPPSADRRYRKSIAERLIYHEVLSQEAKSLGVEATLWAAAVEGDATSGLWSALEPWLAAQGSTASREEALVAFGRHESAQEAETPVLVHSAACSARARSNRSWA